MNSGHERIGLAAWGWDLHWARLWEEGRYLGEPARVVAVDRGSLLLGSARGLLRAPPGRTPVTAGDWCAVMREGGEQTRVRAVLPRRSWLVRRAAGRATFAQELAANVETAFLMCGLDRGQGLRSIERLLTIVLDGGVQPVIVLNKADLCEDLEGARRATARAAPGVEVLAVSALTREGLQALTPYLSAGSTVALLGPSGMGKSTLVNALADGERNEELTRVGPVRESDGRGRHTTTRRHLHPLPGGALLLDTPGLRELGGWVDADGVAQAFSDVQEFVKRCRFHDCRHDSEPGCALREALLEGELEPERLHRFLELTEEAAALDARRSRRGQLEAKRQLKLRSKQIRRYYRDWK